MLEDTIRQDFCLLKDKAGVRWLKDGDLNSAFYHGTIKARRNLARINFVTEEDSDVQTSEQIGAYAVDYYSNLLSGHPPPPSPNAFGSFEKVISDEDNGFLTKMPLEDEIFHELKGMSDDSAPSPDGFTSRFYVFFWDIIKADVVNAVAAFFHGIQILKIVGATYLTLIFKYPNPCSISDLHPISLCNVVHKLFSRILNTRLSNM
ncbi:hypothetical protein QQ045_018453 [Rhodiola kirilowii]